MTESKAAERRGLEGVYAADSAICKIDGEVGELRYRGYLLKDLADNADFTETTWLLWHGELPTNEELAGFRVVLRGERVLSRPIRELIAELAPNLEPMDCIRTVVSTLCLNDPPHSDDDRKANIRHGIRLQAKLPTIVASYARIREGKDPLEPRDDLSHAANFLYMLTGKEPTEEESRMLDVCLVLHAEHGFNASTFAARVTAATLSDMYSATTSAIGTLKGPLHGGANTAVMNMLIEVGTEDGIEPYLDGLLARGEKVMGFGHRVYKVVDPRALVLKEFSRTLAQSKGEPKWFNMSEQLETLMKMRKGIDMNVDFYSASTYYYMGIRPELFTCIFAVSRISGWVAHILEQYGNNRLIRPRARWIGSESRDFVPLDQRG